MKIDFHAHVLPGIDDGSKSVDMSLKMLEGSGADIVVATPHFYGDRQRLDAFLAEREEAWNRLVREKAAKPGLALGAEAAYFTGISRAEGLEALCIRGTRVLMLELPLTRWDEAVIREVRVLSESYVLILAHLERYLGNAANVRKIAELQKLPLYVQVNAGSMTKWLLRRRIALHIGKDFLPGSDMHDLGERGPNLLKGFAAMEKDRREEAELLGSRLIKGAVIR